ncbi:MAG: hypothetical protein U1A27_06740 [Phycisphaerae bacterium]
MVNGAAAAAAIARAIGASGVVVRLEPQEFGRVLERCRDGVVVTAPGGLFRTKFCYLTSYKGLAFHTLSREPLTLPHGIETVVARRIWCPG